MSEEVAKYYTDHEEMLCDNFIKLWKRENCDMSIVINAILETIGTEAGCGPCRKLYRSTLEWEKRLFNKDPEAYRRNIEKRLEALLADGRR